jgi:hypothetical protein
MTPFEKVVLTWHVLKNPVRYIRLYKHGRQIEREYEERGYFDLDKAMGVKMTDLYEPERYV